MEYYTKVPNRLYDDVKEGNITHDMFTILIWLYRRADYSSGKVKMVTAERIRAEMWGNSRKVPATQTIRDSLRLLNEHGYICSYHKAGHSGSYPVRINNYEVTSKDAAGDVTNAVLNPTVTTGWQDDPESCRCDNDSAAVVLPLCQLPDNRGDNPSDNRSAESTYILHSLDPVHSVDSINPEKHYKLAASGRVSKTTKPNVAKSGRVKVADKSKQASKQSDEIDGLYLASMIYERQPEVNKTKFFKESKRWTAIIEDLIPSESSPEEFKDMLLWAYTPEKVVWRSRKVMA